MPLWEVVGGAAGGGIVVREGEKLASPELARLGTGAVVREKELKADRLHFELVCGEGPASGWVSLKMKGRDLVVKCEGTRPFWLKPSRVKGSVLFLSIPWKGHIVHLRRIGQWFLGLPGLRMHFACFPAEEADLRKQGFEVHVTEGEESVCSEYFAVIEDGFRDLARGEKQAQSEGGAKLLQYVVRHQASYMEKNQDPLASYFSFCFRVLGSVKPDVVVCDGFCGYSNLVPAYCAAEQIRFLPVQSPGIPEDFTKNVDEGAPQVEDDKLPPEITAKAFGVSVELVKAMEQKVEPSQMPQANPSQLSLMGLGGMVTSLPLEVAGFMASPLAKKLKVPVKVAGAIIKNLATGTYMAEIYPSTRSVVGQQTLKERCLFASPLLPLPKPLENGQLQRDKETFEATLAPVEPELLAWLFSEDKAPIVYVAFGSIVRPSQDMISKLAKALDGEWRVLWVLPDELQGFLPSERPASWRVERFVPQADVLKCDRIRCFLSHMGANSTTESLVCSVPMLCCPFYMDQFEWTWTVCEHLGAGLQIAKTSSVEEIQSKLRRRLVSWRCLSVGSPQNQAAQEPEEQFRLKEKEQFRLKEEEQFPLKEEDEEEEQFRLKEEDEEEDEEEVKSPWPFLSSAEQRLADVSAGQHWPWKNTTMASLKGRRLLEGDWQLSEFLHADITEPDLANFSDLDLDLAAAAAAAASGSSELWGALRGQEGRVEGMFCGSLVAILGSLRRAPEELRRSWLPPLVHRLLQIPLSPRHALVLLASMKNAKAAFGGQRLPTDEVLETAAAALHARQQAKLPVLDVVLALESLADLRKKQPGAARLATLAAALLRALGGGPGLSQLVAQSAQERNRAMALRLLAVFADFPEALGAAGEWLAGLSDARYGRDAVVGQETEAAAAFALSRCGAWKSARANFLLSQALRRDLEAAEPRVKQVLDEEPISGPAGSWWLAACAMCGESLDAAAGRPEAWAQRAPEALGAAVERLLGEPGGPEHRDGDPGSAARALWALHALGLAAEKEDLAAQLLRDLAEMEPSFGWQTWQLLRELQPLLAQESAECPFALWKGSLEESLEAERTAFLGSARRGQLEEALKVLCPSEPPELGFRAGPLCIALYWSGHNFAVDIDCFYSAVTPVLRRQLWAKVLPEVQVKEISLAEWDRADVAQRARLLQPPEDLDASEAGGAEALLQEEKFTQRAARISQVMRVQAQLMLEKLGPHMAQKEGLGVGASVTAALILAALSKEPPDWLFQAVAETTAAAEATVGALASSPSEPAKLIKVYDGRKFRQPTRACPTRELGHGMVFVNVGGRVFCASEDTLRRCGGFLARALDGTIPLDRDQEGRLFLDRDPELFEWVLRFARTGEICKDFPGALQAEFDYLLLAWPDCCMRCKVRFDPSRNTDTSCRHHRFPWMEDLEVSREEKLCCAWPERSEKGSCKSCGAERLGGSFAVASSSGPS
ncbi:unnamed protein product [Effrenium voratum]|nr:unnamed protein product [Effrenium voratum]